MGSNSTPSARQTWADISEDDPSTVVGSSGQVTSDKPKSQDETDTANAEADDAEDSVDRLREKLARRKEVVELMANVGYKKGEAAFDSASQEVETLTAQIAERDPKREKPYAVALLHAQKALDRATNARAKLDTALDEFVKEYEDKLEQLIEKMAAAEERIELHAKKVADLKASIGPQPPPRELGGNLLGAAGQIQAYSADLSVLFQLAKSNPSYSEHVAKVENCEGLLTALHKVLVDSGGALSPKDGEEAQVASNHGPKDGDDDMDDADVEGEQPEHAEKPAAPQLGGSPPAASKMAPALQPSLSIREKVKEKANAVVASSGLANLRQRTKKAQTHSKAKGEQGKGTGGAARTKGDDALPPPEPTADSPMEEHDDKEEAAANEQPPASGGA